MDIKKFGDFINEDVKIPVVDVLIDDNGNIYNGIKPEFPLRKGNISQVITKIPSTIKKAGSTFGKKITTTKIVIDSIIGSDKKEYPFGVDKNGYLVYPDGKVDEEGYVLDSKDNRIPTENNKFADLYRNFFNDREWRAFIPPIQANNKIDYSFLLPMTPTGWVNVKVDMEVLKRVRRYALSLGDNDRGFESFVAKLEEMSEISGRDPGKKHRGFSKGRANIQKEMSVIILLHYINEIKDFFTPGSSGFLFESFLSGLIPGSKVIDDNGVADVVAGDSKYQIKLYSNVYNDIPVNMKNGFNDYYVIGIKNPQDIDIYLVDNSNPATSVLSTLYKTREKSGSVFNLSALKASDQVLKFKIELSRLEEKIESIGEGLKSSLDSLYSELSDFQYNIETIITGVDNKGQVINADEFKSLQGSAEQNVTIMRSQLAELIKSVNRREVRGENRQPRPKPNQ
jgi:hypothetical protein